MVTLQIRNSPPPEPEIAFKSFLNQKIELRQAMGVIVMNRHSKFELNATRNDGALGFFQRASPPNNDDLTTTTTRLRINTTVLKYFASFTHHVRQTSFEEIKHIKKRFKTLRPVYCVKSNKNNKISSV